MSKTEQNQKINYNFLSQQSCGFRIAFNSNGEEVYEWVDSPINELSSVKLVKMLQMVKEHSSQKDNSVLIEIKEELAKRGNEISWNLPH